MSQWWHTCGLFFRKLWIRSPFYFLTLLGKAPRQLSVAIPDPWPGDILSGRNLMDGLLSYQGRTILLTELWHPEAFPTDYVHKFEWLRNLRAIGDNSARRLSRQLLMNWIQRNKNNHSEAWSPVILGQRVANLISLSDFFCVSADEEFQRLFFKSLIRQYHHLRHSYKMVSEPTDILLAMKGLIFTSIAFTDERHRLSKYLKKYEQALQKQLSEDGGHYSRSPAIQLRLLRDLIDIRAALRVIAYNDVKEIQAIIEKIAPIVRLLRHGDGELADFGHTDHIPANIVDMALSLADVRGKPPRTAEHTGFERCVSKQTIVLLNTGKPISTRLSDGTGLMNYEWSIGRNRIVLQGDIILQTRDGQYLKAPLSQKKESIKTMRYEEEGHVFIDGSYETKEAEAIFSHHRQLYLDPELGGLKGQDRITANQEVLCAVRFLMNPEYETHLSKSGKGAIIHFSTHKRIRLITSGCEEIFWDHCEWKENAEKKAPAILLFSQIKPHEVINIKWAFREDR